MHGRALPHGICLNVGIGGHSVFGGYGFASRMWGLNLDVIESVDVVLADGTQKTISADQDQDSKNLFWAMRGAAPSFAIVTAIKYKTFPVPGFAENFEYGRQMGFQEAAHIIHNLQIDALHTSSVPKELGLQFRIDKGNSADKVKLTLRGTYYGPQTTWVSVISPYLKQIMNITESTSGSLAEMVNSINLTGHLAADPTTSFTGGYVEEVPGDYYQSVYRNAADPTVTGDSIVYAKFLDQVNDTSARGVDRDIYIKTLVTSGPRILEKSLPPDPRITFYIKTLMAPQSKPITYQALEALIKYAATNGFESKLDWYVVLKLFGGKDSVITSTPSDKTSFGRRDTLWFIELNADSRTFPCPEEGYTFLDGLVKTVLVNSPQSWDYGAYPGFLDDRLDNYQHLYYGKHYDKLVELKNKFDQSNIFSFPTSIPLKKF